MKMVTPKRQARGAIALVLLLVLANNTGCSVRNFAMKKVGDALANSGTTFARDDDPELVRDAVPFSLKLMESVLEENPKHRGLLLAACRSFTQYAYAYIQEEADEKEARDLAAASFLRGRARRLYLRGRNYGLQGLELKYPGLEAALRENPGAAARRVSAGADVPLLYWTAAAWGAAIAVSKDHPELIADQPIVEALMDRAFQLDEKFAAGAVHSFLITYEQSRQGAPGDPAARSRKHFERAMELSGGQLAAPLVALAESVCVSQQKRAEFEALLKRALAVNADARPEWRLENLVMQRRARWLLARADELFVE